MATKNLNNHNNKTNNKTNNKSTLTPIFNKNIKNNPQNSSKSSYAPQPRKNPTSGNLAYNLNSTNSFNKNRTTKSDTRNPSKSFMSALEDTHNLIYNPAKFMSNHNLTLTENGAVTHSTSGSALLDINFSVSSLRGADIKTITTKFRKAFEENPVYAVRWLFFSRDIRGDGLGERNLFRVIYTDLAKNGMHEFVKATIPYVAEMGRWDDLWCLLDVKAHGVNIAVLECVKAQLKNDIENYHAKKNISLLSKWIPSSNTSSKETRRLAGIIRTYLKWNYKEYQQTLSNLRAYLNIVERDMSSNNWQSIDYEAVPSKANLLYNKAFLRHDEKRRRNYLEALTKGEAKINASTTFPHDIVHKYVVDGVWGRLKVADNRDPAIEAMWKSQKDYGISDTLVVADGSGSMTDTISGTTVTALEVANALAIYCSERNSGEFKNKYITFSEKPQFVNFEENWSLREKLAEAFQHNEVANTNIEKTFDLILETAIRNNMSQDEMVKNVLVISDMQFDSATYLYNCTGRLSRTLFQTIEKRFNEAGYQMPRLVFWNVMNKRNNGKDTLPVSMNENFPCALVSGYSASILKMVMSGEIDPYNVLIEALMNERYDKIEEALREAM